MHVLDSGSHTVPLYVTIAGLGGTITVSYACEGCKRQAALFDSSYRQGCTSKIGKAVQVAFILSGSSGGEGVSSRDQVERTAGQLVYLVQEFHGPVTNHTCTSTMGHE